MDLTPEQLLAAHKANVEALAGMTRQAFSGMEQLIELNLSLTKTLLAEAHQLSLDSMSVKDTQELLTLQTGLLAPMTHKILSYQNELTQMAQSLGSNFGLQAQSQLEQGQAQIQQGQRDGWRRRRRTASVRGTAAPCGRARQGGRTSSTTPRRCGRPCRGCRR